MAQQEDNLEFLARHNQQSGVYMIAPRKPVKWGQHYLMVKVGMSGNLGQRLKSYLLYWPHGYHVYQVIHTQTTDDALTVEKAVHKLLKHKKRNIEELHAHTQEWFWLSVANMKLLLTSVSEYFPTLLQTTTTTHTMIQEQPYLLTQTPLTWGSHKIQPLKMSEKKQWTAVWQKRDLVPLSTLKKVTKKKPPQKKHPPKRIML
jgi:hypothetical protein